MLLLTEEKWVREDRSLKVSSEHDFDVACSLQILNAQIWKLFPL
jgi:hypothetical protein